MSNASSAVADDARTRERGRRFEALEICLRSPGLCARSANPGCQRLSIRSDSDPPRVVAAPSAPRAAAVSATLTAGTAGAGSSAAPPPAGPIRMRAPPPVTNNADDPRNGRLSRGFKIRVPPPSHVSRRRPPQLGGCEPQTPPAGQHRGQRPPRSGGCFGMSGPRTGSRPSPPGTNSPHPINNLGLAIIARRSMSRCYDVALRLRTAMRPKDSAAQRSCALLKAGVSEPRVEKGPRRPRTMVRRVSGSVAGGVKKHAGTPSTISAKRLMIWSTETGRIVVLDRSWPPASTPPVIDRAFARRSQKTRRDVGQGYGPRDGRWRALRGSDHRRKKRQRALVRKNERRIAAVLPRQNSLRVSTAAQSPDRLGRSRGAAVIATLAKPCAFRPGAHTVLPRLGRRQ